MFLLKHDNIVVCSLSRYSNIHVHKLVIWGL